MPISTTWSESLGTVWPRGKSKCEQEDSRPRASPGSKTESSSRSEMGTSLVGLGREPHTALTGLVLDEGPRLRPSGAPLASVMWAALTAALLPR